MEREYYALGPLYIIDGYKYYRGFKIVDFEQIVDLVGINFSDFAMNYSIYLKTFNKYNISGYIQFLKQKWGNLLLSPNEVPANNSVLEITILNSVGVS